MDVLIQAGSASETAATGPGSPRWPGPSPSEGEGGQPTGSFRTRLHKAMAQAGGGGEARQGGATVQQQSDEIGAATPVHRRSGEVSPEEAGPDGTVSALLFPGILVEPE